jgi:HK97 family phage prohead protease
MPYFISDSAEGCAGWGVIKQDGEVLGCHDTKQAAIDQMVALSVAEGIEPGGERVANAAVAVITDIDDTIIERGTRPIRDVIEHINNLPGDLFVITGREERQRATTVTTLTNAGLRAFTLFMRPDESVDTVSFKTGEAERLAQSYRITHVFENDADTREAYAGLGLTVLDPADFEVRAEPGELALGDFVEWDSSGGMARGQVEHIMTEGVLGIPDSDFSINASEDDPAALIRIFAAQDDGFVPTETLVGHRFSTLTKIDALQPPSEDRAENIPQYIQDAAARGLELNREGYGGDGLTDATLREARAMARGEMSDDKVVRANAWGARHEVDLEAPKNRDPEHPEWPGAGAVAHYLWGIDPLDPGPARQWLEREVERIRDERTEMQNVEVRTFDAEMRAIGDDSNGMTFGGYAWRYNEPSLPLPFTERIAQGAFTRTLKSRNDVRAYYNHNDELLLGSTRAKTLRIEDRPDGGYVEIDLPDTEIGRSTAYHIRRGDITGMSFGFSTVADEWSTDGNERTLQEVRLHEVSVVSGVPAYPSTTASVRNLKVIAHRTEMDADELSDAMTALQSGELSDDQANILRTLVDKMTGKTDEPQPTVPLSILEKQMELLAKAF